MLMLGSVCYFDILGRDPLKLGEFFLVVVCFSVCLFEGVVSLVACLGFSGSLESLSGKTRLISLEASYKIFKANNCPLSFKVMLQPGAIDFFLLVFPTALNKLHYASDCCAPLSTNNLPSPTKVKYHIYEILQCSQVEGNPVFIWVYSPFQEQPTALAKWWGNHSLPT